MVKFFTFNLNRINGNSTYQKQWKMNYNYTCLIENNFFGMMTILQYNIILIRTM